MFIDPVNTRQMTFMTSSMSIGFARWPFMPAADAVLQDIAAAERDYEQAKFRGFSEDEIRQYTALERRVQENEKQILQK